MAGLGPYAAYLAGASERVPWDYGGRYASDLGLRIESYDQIQARGDWNNPLDFGWTENGTPISTMEQTRPSVGTGYAYDDANGIRWTVDDRGYVIPGTNESTRSNRDFGRFTLALIGAMAGAGAAGAGGAGGAAAAEGGAAAAGAGGASAGAGAAGAGAAGAGAAGAGAAGAAGAGAGAAGGAAGTAGAGMSWFDWASLAANAANAYTQDRAAGRATDAQVNAANAATGLQRDMFDRINAQQGPYREAGYAALGDLMGLRNFDPTPTAASVMAEPGYEFARSEGIRGIENSAAARGGALSGNTLRRMAGFNNDLATQRYGEAWNRAQANNSARWGRLSALAGIGQAANQVTNQANQSFANNAGQNMMGAGNAIGAGAMVRGNIYGNAINQGVSQWGRMNGQYGGGSGGMGGFGAGYNLGGGYGYGGQPGWSNDPGADPYYMGG